MSESCLEWNFTMDNRHKMGEEERTGGKTSIVEDIYVCAL